MKRRDFIKSIFYTTSAVGTLGLPLDRALATGNPFPELNRTLVNIMLLGGADLRFLFVPHPDEPLTQDYIPPFWAARKALYRFYSASAGTTVGYENYRDLWDGVPASDLPPLYETVEFDGFRFGMHTQAKWLIDQFRLGNVAIVCNVFASTNRRHDHSQLIVHTGDVTTAQFDYDVSGWGGRLAEAIGATANVVPVSTGVPPFAQSSTAGNRLDRTVHLKNSRDFALPYETADITSPSSMLGRALKAYYAEHREDIEAQIKAGRLPENWPFRKFLQHEKVVRDFGDAIKERLDSVSRVNPLRGLPGKLKNRGFGLQCANLYDALLASDLLNLRLAYLEYGSWDTHHTQKTRFENNLGDVFGANGGLATLYRVAGSVAREMVLVFTSDFGRQLAANGSRGTDHGVGSYTILVGEAVNGGIYGEMFPASESTPDANGQTRFDIQGADIAPRTALERVLGELADWVQPGAAPVVFPRLAIADPADPNYPPIEAGVDLGQLLARGNSVDGEVIEATRGLALEEVQITATNANGFSRRSTTGRHGHYHIWGLPDGDYTLTPSKAYFTFDPPRLDLTVSGGHVEAPAFSAKPLLHIKYAGVSSWGPNTVAMLALGYNFVPNETVVTIGSTVATIIQVTTTMLLVSVPQGTTGLITVTTPNENYTHPVPFENL